jgi:uncharacterized protein (TIGR03067 family)
MRPVVACVILLGSGAWATERDNEPAVKAELKKLEGTWEGYAVEGKGEKPDRGPVHIRITIAGDKISAVDLGNKEKDMGSGTFKIDPTKQLKEIDATGIVLPGKREKTYQGIYELDGDTLKWCVDNRQKERPTEFRTVSGNFLLILKRKK